MDFKTNFILCFFLFQVQQKNVDDATVARSIAAKFKDSPSVSYIDIANKAEQCGRVALAVRVRLKH